MVQPVPTKAFVQPIKAAAMCTALHAETRPPPYIVPFLLAQNLSSKRIAPTDYMRPKSDDVRRHHRLRIKNKIAHKAALQQWSRNRGGAGCCPPPPPPPIIQQEGGELAPPKKSGSMLLVYNCYTVSWLRGFDY